MATARQAGSCCCGNCCKPKDWVFNYPFYRQGTRNPWGKDGRVTTAMLITWSKESSFRVKAKFPDGGSCDDPTDKTVVIGTATKAIIVKDNPINITLKGIINTPVWDLSKVFGIPDLHSGLGVQYFTIQPCNPSKIGLGFIPPLGVFRTVGFGNLSDYNYDDCSTYTFTQISRGTLNPGRYIIKIQMQNQIAYTNNTTIDLIIQGLTSSNECP